MVTDRGTDKSYLAYQYADAEKLRIRQDAHHLYSEFANQRFLEWVVAELDAGPGALVLDAGCGNGPYHQLICARGARLAAFDYSLGMARVVKAQATPHSAARSTVVFQADAQAIPLRAGICDRVLAAHMLYHVPDQRRALEDMRRVLREGGRLVLVTGGGRSSRLRELHDEVARELGYTPTTSPAARFTLDHVPLVRSVFPDATAHLFPNAFLFPTAEAALSYYASGMVDSVAERDTTSAHRRQFLAFVAERVHAEIGGAGVFRDPKDNGCIVATA